VGQEEKRDIRSREGKLQYEIKGERHKIRNRRKMKITERIGTKKLERKMEGKSAKLKNGVFWDVTPCGSCKNRRFGGT
jgi:hypothetical protein